MPHRNPVTLRDVSVASGFSTFTVSRALSGLSGISEETRAVVRRVARELGYVPNQQAQRLKRGTSTTIGVLTANSENPFYAKLVNGFEDIVIPAGFHTIISDATDHGIHSPKRESKFLEQLLEQRVAGIALTYHPSESQLQRLVDWPMPLVFIDAFPPKAHPDLSSVVVDGEQISYEVGKHFEAHGYRDWMFLGHPREWSTRMGRQRGFARAAEECGAHLTIVEGRNHASEAAESVLDSIAQRGRPPRAIFAANEPLVIGTLRALRMLNLSVPGDVALVGYDETDWAEFAAPALTLVDQSISRIGRIGGMRLLAQLVADSTTDFPPAPVPELIVRDSCGPH